MSQITSSCEVLTPIDNKPHESHNVDNINSEYEIKKEPPEYNSSGGSFALLASIKNTMEERLKTHSKHIRYLCYIILHTLLIAYFAWATHYFLNGTNNPLDSTMCSGYGLFMILFIFINFGVAYSWILKPYFIPILSKIIWKFQKKYFEGLFRHRFSHIIAYGAVFACIIGYLIYDSRETPSRLIPLTGLCLYFIIGLIMCNNPSRIKWQPVIWGFILQFTFGLITVRWEVGRNIFGCIGDKVAQFLGYSNDGAAFVYGDFLVRKEAVFVFQALSAIYFLSFMVNILYHYGIMQKVILVIGQFLQAVMGTTICESVNSAANIFLGMTEAPLLLKPYLQDLTAAEIFSIMSAAFATVSGTVLAAYISFGANASHLITASVMSAPAALCFTKLVHPETEETKATKETIAVTKSDYSSALDAASGGATLALEIVLGVTANLIAFISTLYFLNAVLAFLGELVGYSKEDTWTIEKFAGYMFIPVSYTMGVPWDECNLVGKLIGIKTIVNEFAAYKEMGQMALRPRTKVIATYALCGFSNPASIGIMISSMCTLMPNRRALVTQLVFKAFVAGAIICFMTACIAALLIPENLLEI